jgi:hypothetical protein
MKSRSEKKLLTIAAAVLITALMGCSNNPYDFLLKDPSIKTLQENYNENAKSSRLLMDYVELIVDTPQNLIKILERDGCEKNILSFIRKNPDLGIVIVHSSILTAISRYSLGDQEVQYSTRAIKNQQGSAEAAGNKDYLRSLYSYTTYETLTARGGLKDAVERVFHEMKKYSEKNK